MQKFIVLIAFCLVATSACLWARPVPARVIMPDGKLVEGTFVRLFKDTVEYQFKGEADTVETVRLHKFDVKKVEITENDSLELVDLNLSNFEITTVLVVKDTIAKAPEPKKGKAVLWVNSFPDGARVYIDNILLEGTTPMTVPELKSKKTQVMVRKYLKGVDWWGNAEVELNEKDTTKVTIKLLKPRTQLKIQSIPTGAEAYLDQKPSLNRMPKYLTDTTLIDVRPGLEREVSFFKVGYYDTSVVIPVEAYMPNLISVDMRPIEDDLTLLDSQLDFIKQRKKRYYGRGLLYTAIAPIVSGAVMIWLADRDWEKAADYKHMYQDAAFHSTETDRFIKENDRLNESGDLKAKIAVGLGAAGAVFAISGLVLQF